MICIIKPFTVCFFGHRYLNDFARAEEQLKAIISNLLETKEYVEFLVGRNGDFDRLASSTIQNCRKACGNENSALILVLPYMTAEQRSNEKAFTDYYTEVEISYNASKAHFKAAMRIRNREMIDRCDLAVFFVEREQGGAYRAYQYALQKNKPIINLAEIDENK